MAVPVEVIPNAQQSDFVPTTSRYMSSDVLLRGDDRIITFEIYKRQLKETTIDDLVSIITPGEEYRPDITSLYAYNTPDYWWQIMEANSFSDVFHYKAGLTIRIPALTGF